MRCNQITSLIQFSGGFDHSSATIDQLSLCVCLYTLTITWQNFLRIYHFLASSVMLLPNIWEACTRIDRAFKCRNPTDMSFGKFLVKFCMCTLCMLDAFVNGFEHIIFNQIAFECPNSPMHLKYFIDSFSRSDAPKPKPICETMLAIPLVTKYLLVKYFRIRIFFYFSLTCCWIYH